MMERVAGIEPALSAWKAGVIPLYDTRKPAEKYCFSALSQRFPFSFYHAHYRTDPPALMQSSCWKGGVRFRQPLGVSQLAPVLWLQVQRLASPESRPAFAIACSLALSIRQRVWLGR